MLEYKSLMNNGGRERESIDITWVSLSYLLGVLDDVAHVPRITADEECFGPWRHFHFEHEDFCYCLAAEQAEILHFCNEKIDIFFSLEVVRLGECVCIGIVKWRLD